MLLQVDHISKKFHDELVLHDINLTLHQKRTTGILGKSGCGKTTLLKIIAGLIKADEGHIILNDINIDQQPANLRHIVYMSQEALLFPHLSVFENVAFGLRINKEKKIVVTKKVNALIDSLGLGEHSSKLPHQLSGGQKQRVNFGRALIINPPLLLLDEPFGNLDTQTRTEMQQLFKKIATEFSISSIFVTHDIKEALLMGDNIAYMKNGNLKTYPDKNSFITDIDTGVQQEIAFWQSL
jgi:ABC-type Fe3+/spermidine/putrescine transport system ATPase subunit